MIGFPIPPLHAERLMSMLRWILTLTLLSVFVLSNGEHASTFGDQARASEIADPVKDMATIGIVMPVRCASCTADEMSKKACVPLVCANALLALSSSWVPIHTTKARYVLRAEERISGLEIQPNPYPPEMIAVLS